MEIYNLAGYIVEIIDDWRKEHSREKGQLLYYGF